MQSSVLCSIADKIIIKSALTKMEWKFVLHTSAMAARNHLSSRTRLQNVCDATRLATFQSLSALTLKRWLLSQTKSSSARSTLRPMFRFCHRQTSCLLPIISWHFTTKWRTAKRAFHLQWRSRWQMARARRYLHRSAYKAILTRTENGWIINPSQLRFTTKPAKTLTRTSTNLKTLLTCKGIRWLLKPIILSFLCRMWQWPTRSSL